MGDESGVIVVGGGATGTGVARDLAMRGVDVRLVECGGVAAGTTGRMHGLLHSGARYVNDDPRSAADCLAENTILREIAGHCLVATGGLFVQGPGDDPEYFEAKAAACRDHGIPAERLDSAEARSAEPTLSADIERALRVPDAAIDSGAVAAATAQAAENHGARVDTETEALDLSIEDGRVTGVVVETAAGARSTLPAAHVVNATGPWAGTVAGMAGIDLELRHSKGSMVVLDVPDQRAVVNWCRPKGQADIVVPFAAAVVLGTTDIPVDGPGHTGVEDWEITELVNEMSILLPGLADASVEGAYAGVRPLYSPGDAGPTATENVTRDFFLIDHGDRDGIAGFTSIVGGKFTTHRLMAERAADHVAGRLGVSAASQTADVALPGADDPGELAEAIRRFGATTRLPRRVEGGS